MEKLQKLLIDFEDLVNKDVDVDEIIPVVNKLKESFEAELEIYQAQKLGEFLGEGGEEGNFVPEKLVEESKYNDLVFIVNNRKQIKEEAIAEEYSNNLKQKQSIINNLRNLIENEENIGKAFDTFNELRANWKEIGNVSSHDYKTLQAEYSNLLEAFFYNINIYKELKDHDLKRNLQLREDLIVKMEALLTEKVIKQVQSLAGTYLSEWDEIGPVHKDDWTKTRDKFKTITKKVFDRVKEHYNEIKEKRQKNLEAKESLLNKTKEIIQKENQNEKDWRFATEAILNIQKEWKTIGYATKKENDKVWEDFRNLCDTFFNAKALFYSKEKSKWDDNKAKKLKLIETAKTFKSRTDWKETTLKVIKLQNDWKKIGSAGQKVEQALWKQFREACDTFFSAKKEWFDGMDDRHANNLKEKQDFITKIKETKLSGDSSKDRSTIKQYIAEWNKLGHVSKKHVKETLEAFNNAIDELYKQIDNSKGLETIKFEDRLEGYAQHEKSEKLLKDELQFIKGKIDNLTKDKLQYENNLSFLGFSSGKNADKMREDVNKKITEVENQVAKWDKKLRLVKKALREIKTKENA